jgi:hypothetical protein
MSFIFLFSKKDVKTLKEENINLREKCANLEQDLLLSQESNLSSSKKLKDFDRRERVRNCY